MDGEICRNGECINKQDEIDDKACESGEVVCYEDNQIIVICDDSGHWGIPQLCQEGTKCNAKDKKCVAEPCKNGQKICNPSSGVSNYKECQDGAWIDKECSNGKICSEGKCVPNEDDDCEKNKFLGCTNDKTQKIIQKCNPNIEDPKPCDSGMICDPQSEGCINIPAPPIDPCSYDTIKAELTKAKLGCDDMSKTFIISSSTDLKKLNNWHDNDNKSCLVFCGDIALDDLTD